MPGPFGQFSVNEVYAPLIQAQESRIRNMILNQQLAAGERQAERDNGIRQVIARHLGQQGQGGQRGGGSSQQPAAPSRGLSELVSSFGQPDTSWTPQAAPSPQQAPTQAAPAFNRQAFFQDLVGAGLTPVEARQQLDAMGEATPQQLQALQEQSVILHDFLSGVRALPLASRAAAIEQSASRLSQLGIEPNSVRTDDAWLDEEIRQAGAFRGRQGNGPNIQREVEYYRSLGRNDLAEQLLTRHAEGGPLIANNGDGTFTVIPRSSQQGQAPRGNAPPAAIDYLRSNPGTAAQFDEMYGPGAAQRILQGGPSQQQPAAGSF